MIAWVLIAILGAIISPTIGASVSCLYVFSLTVTALSRIYQRYQYRIAVAKKWEN